MTRALTTAEVREIDRIAIEECGLPGIVLMENAGAGTARLLDALGGDGFVIARHLDLAGHVVKLLLACRPAEVRGDAAVNLRVVERAGLDVACLADADEAAWTRALDPAAWIVDALLGTGASGPPTGAVATAITAINEVRRRGRARVLAVDLPSGLDGDTGAAPGACVRADVTATFVARKAGFDAAGAAALTGAVHVVDIGAPRAVLARFTAR